MSAISDHSDPDLLLIVLFEDIQHRKSTERRFQVLADSLPGLLLYIDRSLVVQFVNVMGEKWYAQGIGLATDEMLGHSLRHVLSPEKFEFVSPWIARALKGETVEFITLERFQNGDPRFLSIIYAPHFAVHDLAALFGPLADYFATEAYGVAGAERGDGPHQQAAAVVERPQRKASLQHLVDIR